MSEPADFKGCHCTKQQLHKFLRAMGCDQVEGGFVVSGNIVSFLGAGKEFVIGSSARYYVNGVAFPLAANYSGVTGRGATMVII